MVYKLCIYGILVLNTSMSLYNFLCLRFLCNNVILEWLVCTHTQGHESAIVILSLVRHNRSKKLGITADNHRLVVATSRQKRALYIVGNAAFLKDASSYCWKVRPYMYLQQIANTVTYTIIIMRLIGI